MVTIRMTIVYNYDLLDQSRTAQGRARVARRVARQRDLSA